MIDIGARSGPISLQLYTDTLELRLQPEGSVGRAWIAARAEVGAAGMFITPWTDGAPDFTRALSAYYVGLEGGALAYFPHGLYAGPEISVRRWIFRGKDSTTIPVPEDSFVISPSLTAGWWTEPFHIYLRGGFDDHAGTISPRVSLDARLHLETAIAPLIEVRAGWADKADDVTRIRMGGLNPYVVPLAGAGWGEFWVERYVAVRAGPSVRIDPVRVALVFDGARFDDDRKAYGVALLGTGRWGRFFVDGAVGYAPSIPRQNGVGRASVWLIAGFDWTEL